MRRPLAVLFHAAPTSSFRLFLSYRTLSDVSIFYVLHWLFLSQFSTVRRETWKCGNHQSSNGRCNNAVHFRGDCQTWKVCQPPLQQRSIDIEVYKVRFETMLAVFLKKRKTALKKIDNSLFLPLPFINLLRDKKKTWLWIICGGGNWTQLSNSFCEDYDYTVSIFQVFVTTFKRHEVIAKIQCRVKKIEFLNSSWIHYETFVSEIRFQQRF